MDNKITYNTRSNPSSSYLNKKRNMFSYYNTTLFKPLISTEFKTEYENVLWLYRNAFGFNWSDRFLKDNQNVLANITPHALWFMYTGMYFPNDFAMLEHIEGSSLKEMLLAITGEQDNVNIRKGSNYKMKFNLIEDLKNISQCTHNNNNNSNSNSTAMLHTLCEYIEKKIHRIETINNDKLNAMAHIINKHIASSHTNNDDNNTLLHDDSNINKQCATLITPSALLKDTYPNPHTLNVLNMYSTYLSNLTQHSSSSYTSSLPLLNISSQLTQIPDDDDNYICFICNNGDIDDTTQLIYECECCSITVHQSCYGISTDTSEHWLCDACKHYHNKHITTTLDCILCPVKGGAMKQADLPLDSQFVNTLRQIRNNETQFMFPKYNPHIIIPINTYDTIDKVWVHLSCALWNQNVSFENFEEKKGIKYIDMMDYALFYEMCCVCCMKGYGPVVKCNYDGCEFKAHPECVRINKYGMEVVNEDGTLNYNVYCYKHMPVKYVKRINRRNKQREREVVEFASFLKKVYKGYEKEYHKSIIEMKSIVKMGNGININGYTTTNVHSNSNNSGKSTNIK